MTNNIEDIKLRLNQAIENLEGALGHLTEQNQNLLLEIERLKTKNFHLQQECQNTLAEVENCLKIIEELRINYVDSHHKAE